LDDTGTRFTIGSERILKYNFKNYLKTIGEGIQNLLNVFFIFSCKAFSSRHHVVGSVADGPAVGSV